MSGIGAGSGTDCSVNGIATTGSGVQQAIDHLHEITCRPVTGIHNRTLGAWFDLFECILQRDIHINSANIRNGYKVRMLSMSTRDTPARFLWD